MYKKRDTIEMTQPKPAYHGRFVSFEQVQAHPQRDIPVVVGGHSASAYRRAVEQGTGWYGFALNLNWTTRALADIAGALKRYDRPRELGKLEISVTPRQGTITLENAKRYADLGVDRLIIFPPQLSEVDLKEFVSRIGETVLGRV
jgi:alkanesulfonate monooxygenase SsuD/methylene tetrahydromethanopterin reductase-like flavin-dependent oxidoreductase (luciferase family)